MIRGIFINPLSVAGLAIVTRATRWGAALEQGVMLGASAQTTTGFSILILSGRSHVAAATNMLQVYEVS